MILDNECVAGHSRDAMLSGFYPFDHTGETLLLAMDGCISCLAGSK